MFSAGTHAKDLLSELVLAGGTFLLLSLEVIIKQSKSALLLLVIPPDSFFINQAISCLSVRLLNVLHLETLLESLELLKILPF